MHERLCFSVNSVVPWKTQHTTPKVGEPLPISFCMWSGTYFTDCDAHLCYWPNKVWVLVWGGLSQRKRTSLVNAVEVSNCLNSIKRGDFDGHQALATSFQPQQQPAAQCTILLWGVGDLTSWPKAVGIQCERFHLCWVLLMHSGLFWQNGKSSCLWPSETHRECCDYSSVGFSTFFCSDVCMSL